MRTTMNDIPVGHMDHAGYAEPEPPPSQDVTLGLAALTGIFLAVVLVCALFFGFGYSTGRTLHGARSTPPPNVPTAITSSPAALNQDSGVESSQATAAQPLATAQPITKPSAGTAYTDTSAVTDVATADNSTAPAPAVRAPHAPDQAYAAAPPASLARVPAPTTSADSSAPQAASGVMVQIAAVVHQGDADALAAALRRSGYTAVVRTEPQDKFLHVQVGPFATRDEARSMRARLQADGYNAFMKP